MYAESVMHAERERERERERDSMIAHACKHLHACGVVALVSPSDMRACMLFGHDISCVACHDMDAALC